MTNLVLHWTVPTWAEGWSEYPCPELVSLFPMHNHDTGIVSYPCGYKVWLGPGNTQYGSGDGQDLGEYLYISSVFGRYR